MTPYAVKVCYPMALVDLPRARRIADGMATDERSRGSNAQAHAYGVMALALAKKDPPAARELLGQAFDQITKFPSSNVWPLAVALLGYSETVDPERTREYFWRVLALHMGPVAESWSPDERVARTHDNNCQLALLVALYGQLPELQAELLEPVFRHWSKYTNRKEFDFYRHNSIFIAMALAAPDRAVAWHADFYPKVAKEDRSLIPQPWMTMADALGLEGQELRHLIIEQVFHLWGAGKEDD